MSGSLQALLTGDEALAEGVPPRVGLTAFPRICKWAQHYDRRRRNHGAKNPGKPPSALSPQAGRPLLTAVEAFSPE